MDEAPTEDQAIALLASQFDGAHWCAHRLGSALQDPRVLPHGHPAMWQWGLTQMSLLIAMQSRRVGGLPVALQDLG